MKSSTETLIEALRILSREIDSHDGVANAAIAEAADRLHETQLELGRLQRSINTWRDQYQKLHGELRRERIVAYAKENAEKASWWYNQDGDYSADSPEEVADYCDVDIGGILQVYGAKDVCVKFVAHIPLAYDDDGDLDDSEFQTFNTHEEAKAALEQAELNARAA